MTITRRLGKIVVVGSSTLKVAQDEPERQPRGIIVNVIEEFRAELWRNLLIRSKHERLDVEFRRLDVNIPPPQMTYDPSSKRQRFIFEPMDQSPLILIKLVRLDFDLDSINVERSSKLINIFFSFKLLLGPKECSFDGHSPVGDDTCAGELSTEIGARRPGLELIIRVAELFRRSVAGFQSPNQRG